MVETVDTANHNKKNVIKASKPISNEFP